MRFLVGLFFVASFLIGISGCENEDGASREKETGKETAMSVNLKWLGHASFRISCGESVLYIDPWKLSSVQNDATVVLVSHGHYDHYSAEDIAKISGPETRLIGSSDVIEEEKRGEVLWPGKSISVGDVNVIGVAAYNPSKQFHPKSNNWLGFVIEIGGVRIYYAGDTDVTEEMKGLSDIDLALLPVGGTYTMDDEEAAAVVGHFKPRRAVPYHWGDIVGKRGDADRFSMEAECGVTILKPGDSTEVNVGD
jgi:L-ascorbate metabolism protein UlaG (beta-lactamase superfamily)